MVRIPVKRGLPIRILSVVLLLCLLAHANSTNNSQGKGVILWEELNPGLSLASLKGPRTSKFADSKVTVVRIDPNYYHFVLVASTEYDSLQRTVKDWCEWKNLDGAINAGMYSLEDHISGVGYMRNFSHLNNPVIKESFNAIAVFNPIDSLMPPFQIIDRANQDWKSIVPKYQSCFQSIRMIDNTTQPVFWKKKPAQYCSMTILAVDKSGKVLFIFTRSPYTANEMTHYLLNSALNVQTAMYLEGGPEAALYVRAPEKEILKFGSYVSRTNPDDDNDEARKMPNVLGFRRK